MKWSSQVEAILLFFLIAGDLLPPVFILLLGAERRIYLHSHGKALQVPEEGPWPPLSLFPCKLNVSSSFHLSSFILDFNVFAFSVTFLGRRTHLRMSGWTLRPSSQHGGRGPPSQPVLPAPQPELPVLALASHTVRSHRIWVSSKSQALSTGAAVGSPFLSLCKSLFNPLSLLLLLLLFLFPTEMYPLFPVLRFS